MKWHFVCAVLLLGSVGGCSSTEGDGHDVVMNNDARTATEIAVPFASPEEVAQALVAGGLPCGDYAPHEPGSDPALAQCITVNPSKNYAIEYSMNIVVFSSANVASSWYTTFGLPMGERRKNPAAPNWVWGDQWAVKCTQTEVCKEVQSVLGGQLLQSDK